MTSIKNFFITTLGILVLSANLYAGGGMSGGGMGRANRIMASVAETRFALTQTPESRLILLPESYPEEALKEIQTPPELLIVNDDEFVTLADKETAVGRYLEVIDGNGKSRIFFVENSRVPGAVELVEYFPTPEEWEQIKNARY